MNKEGRHEVRCKINGEAAEVMARVLERTASKWGAVLERLILTAGEDRIVEAHVNGTWRDD